MSKKQMLEGIVVPLCTPFNENEGIDESGLRKLINYVIKHGVHVIFPNGGCGEFPFLTDDERKKVIG